MALQCGADIIDLKDPAQGALGALPLEVITEVVTFIHAQEPSARRLTSATVGDLPMQPALLREQVLALSQTKVDIIKIGFFSDPNVGSTDYQPCIDALMPIARAGNKLVVVLFAEYEYPSTVIPAIRDAGFYGVMLDTAEKNGNTFLDHFSADEMKAFAENVQAQGLLFGLAGSLHLEHVAAASETAPDYIGFRGGVCVNHQRKAELDASKIKAIRGIM